MELLILALRLLKSQAGLKVNTGTLCLKCADFLGALGWVAVVPLRKGCCASFSNYEETDSTGGSRVKSKRPASCFYIAGRRRCVHLFLYRNDFFSVCGVCWVVASAFASRRMRLFPVHREKNGQLLSMVCALRWLCFVSESASVSVALSSFFVELLWAFFASVKKKNSCVVILAEIELHWWDFRWVVVRSVHLPLVTHTRERTLSRRKEKEKKKKHNHRRAC